MRKNLMLAASMLAVAAAVPAQAQDASPADNADTGEIIVTAERREQSLQKLPTTASAVTGEGLADLQIQRVDDLAKPPPASPSMISALVKQSTFAASARALRPPACRRALPIMSMACQFPTAFS